MNTSLLLTVLWAGCGLVSTSLASSSSWANAPIDPFLSSAEDEITLPPIEPPPPAESNSHFEATSAAESKGTESDAMPGVSTSEAPSAHEFISESATEPTREDGKLPSPEEDPRLASPTRSVEEYEAARRRYLHQRSLPRYSINLTIAPRAFGKADLRAPVGPNTGQEDPNLFGVLFGYDHTFFRRGGISMVGLDAGVYTSMAKEPYSGLKFGFLSAQPHLFYQGLFMPRQWVVPSVKLGYELIRYGYSLQDRHVRGFRSMPRLELGLLVYLNLLEPSSAGQMENNYGIKRTYLGAFYSISRDNSKQDFDLSESAFRIGLRLEH